MVRSHYSPKLYGENEYIKDIKNTIAENSVFSFRQCRRGNRDIPAPVDGEHEDRQRLPHFKRDGDHEWQWADLPDCSHWAPD